MVNEIISEAAELIAEGTVAPGLPPDALAAVCRDAALMVYRDIEIGRHGADEAAAVRHLARVSKLAGTISDSAIVLGPAFTAWFDRASERCGDILLQLPAARA